MEEKYRSKNFQNWMKCVLAQNETRKAFCEVVGNRWKGFISCLTEEEREQIEKFLECVKCANIKYLKKDQQKFCNHLECDSLLQKLLKLLHNTSVPDKDYSSNVPSSDRCYFLFWPIAKLFLDVEGEMATEAGLNGLDICHLMHLMDSCQLFAFEGSSKAYRSMMNDRDELFQTSDYNISDEKRQIISEHMLNVLSHFCEPRLNICSDVQTGIHLNQEQDWLIEYQFEYNHITRQTLELKISALSLDLHLKESQDLKVVLDDTENRLREVNDSISAEETAKQHAELVEIESLKETIQLQEIDKKELTCKNQELLKKVSELENESRQASIKNRELLGKVHELEQETRLASTKVTQFRQKLGEIVKSHYQRLWNHSEEAEHELFEEILRFFCRDYSTWWHLVGAVFRQNLGEVLKRHYQRYWNHHEHSDRWEKELCEEIEKHTLDIFKFDLM